MEACQEYGKIIVKKTLEPNSKATTQVWKIQRHEAPSPPVFSIDLKLIITSRDTYRFRSDHQSPPVRGRLKSVRHERARHRLSDPHNQDLQRGHQDVFRTVRAKVTCAEKLNGRNKIQAINAYVLAVIRHPAGIRIWS